VDDHFGAVVETFLASTAEQKSLEDWLCLSAPEWPFAA